MNYILVVDDEADIRDIYEMVLRRSFQLEVVSAESGQEAVQIIRERGLPEIVISDLRMPLGDGVFLYQALKENKWDVPFVICSSDAIPVLQKKFPDIYGYIEKPRIMDPLVEIVSSLFARDTSPKYVPLRISLLLKWGTTNFDLYMKLSDSKFVKVINAGDAFFFLDAERFITKGLSDLFITATDADKYLETFERNISMVINSEKVKSEDAVGLTLESIENVEKISSALGWTPAVLGAAKQAVELAVKTVSLEPNILKLLRQRLANPSSKYSEHVGLLALLSCGFCHQLGWISESTQIKLGLAAILHDITVDEKCYGDIYMWIEAASDPKDKTPEVVKYRNHPIEVANLVLNMKNIPPDLDQIILQHHEAKDGTGFPRGLNAGRISPMASLFIIVEDMVNFIADSSDVTTQIQLFLKLRDERYDTGNFKKVFDAIAENVEKSRRAL